MGCPRALATTPDWSVSFVAGLASPLVAQGKVFVVERESPSPGQSESRLHALDAITGAPVWGPLVFEGLAYAAYDAGQLFVGSQGGEHSSLIALDAQDGRALWVHAFSGRAQRQFAPVAEDGLVVVTFGPGTNGFDEDVGTLAFDQQSGALIWQDRTLRSSDGIPAIDSGRVYFRMQSGVSAHDLYTGEQFWQDIVTSQVMSIPIAAGPDLYTRRRSQGSSTYWDRRDAGTGEVLDTFEISGSRLPTSRGDILYLPGRAARRIPDGLELWPLGGQQMVIVNDAIYVSTGSGIQGTIQAFDAESGEIRAHLDGFSAVSGERLPVKMAVGEGLLLVPGSRRLDASRIGDPAP
ncbi:MAG: PQQ-like beta-propeller repeat protein [Chromatiales bacterium]|nr:PQQ-like beta-propeller repeat protein [Chromatiales bacterium]